MLLDALEQIQMLVCSTLTSSGLCMVLCSWRGCIQSMCHALALLREVVTLSLPCNPMTWYKTNLRANSTVSHAMWDKKLEISVSIGDPKACFTIAFHGHCHPCEVGAAWVFPVQKCITLSLHWCKVLGGGESGLEGDQPDAGFHPFILISAFVPGLLQTGEVW